MVANRSLMLATALVVAIASGESLQAANIATYNLLGVPLAAPSSVPASSVASGIQALDLSRGPGILPSDLTNGFSSQGWNRATPSLATAIANGDYYQFGVTVQPGNVASLSTVDLSLRRSAIAAPMNLELQVSLDGFATPGTPISSFNYYGRTSGTAPVDPIAPFAYMTVDVPGRPNAATSPGDAIPTVDLTGVGLLQNISEGTTVTFRLFAWGNASTASTNTLALGRVTGPAIGGDVNAIPEPTSLALAVGLAAGGLVIRRRRISVEIL